MSTPPPQKPTGFLDTDFMFTATPKAFVSALQEGADIARDGGAAFMAGSEVVEGRRQRAHAARQSNRNDVVTALGLFAGAFGLFRRMRG